MGETLSVSHVDANDWEHDEETGGLVHMLRESDTVLVGHLRPGVIVAMPKGTHTRWVVDDEFRELLIYGES